MYAVFKTTGCPVARVNLNSAWATNFFATVARRATFLFAPNISTSQIIWDRIHFKATLKAYLWKFGGPTGPFVN